jgi:hypothetical protein
LDADTNANTNAHSNCDVYSRSFNTDPNGYLHFYADFYKHQYGCAEHSDRGRNCYGYRHCNADKYRA